MHLESPLRFEIRPARPEEFTRLGQLLVAVYAGLAGMPTLQQQPDYYAMLADVGRRASNPAITVLTATSSAGELLGSVDFIADMQHYASGGTAGSIVDAAGIRLLAVSPRYRGLGLGRALTQQCIERALERHRSRVILHTTKAMQTAWSMYERLGFRRLPEIDFVQGTLEVFGFQLTLSQRDERKLQA